MSMFFEGLFYAKKQEGGWAVFPNPVFKRMKKAVFSNVIERTFPENHDFVWGKSKKMMHKVGESGRMWMLNPKKGVRKTPVGW